MGTKHDLFFAAPVRSVEPTCLRHAKPFLLLTRRQRFFFYLLSDRTSVELLWADFRKRKRENLDFGLFGFSTPVLFKIDVSRARERHDELRLEKLVRRDQTRASETELANMGIFVRMHRYETHNMGPYGP